MPPAVLLGHGRRFVSKQYLPAVKALASAVASRLSLFHQLYQPTDLSSSPPSAANSPPLWGAPEIVETQRGQQANQILLIHDSRLLCHCHCPQYRQHRVIGRQIS